MKLPFRYAAMVLLATLTERAPFGDAWVLRNTPLLTRHGLSTTPALHRNLVIVHSDIGDNESSSSPLWERAAWLNALPVLLWKRLPRKPPPIQDTFVLVGDLLTLAIYGFMDHFVCQDLATYHVQHLVATLQPWQLAQQVAFSSGFTTTETAAVTNQAAVPEVLLQIPTSSLSSVVASMPAVTTTAAPDLLESMVAPPVWLESADLSPYGQGLGSLQVWQSALADVTIAKYSPLFYTTGSAFCALATAWFVAGYFLQAFRLRYTVEATADQALIKTVQTWVAAIFILLLWNVELSSFLHLIPWLAQDDVASSGHALDWFATLFGTSQVSMMDSVQAASSLDATTTVWFQPFFIPWTRADWTYVIDSVTVLMLWRFLVNVLLGTGGGNADSK
jgi:hypothetical protein